MPKGLSLCGRGLLVDRADLIRALLELERFAPCVPQALRSEACDLDQHQRLVLLVADGADLHVPDARRIVLELRAAARFERAALRHHLDVAVAPGRDACS